MLYDFGEPLSDDRSRAMLVPHGPPESDLTGPPFDEIDAGGIVHGREDPKVEAVDSTAVTSCPARADHLRNYF